VEGISRNKPRDLIASPAKRDNKSKEREREREKERERKERKERREKERRHVEEFGEGGRERGGDGGRDRGGEYGEGEGKWNEWEPNRDYETQHRIQAIKKLKKIKDDEEEKIKDEKLRNEKRMILRNDKEKEKEKEHEMELERTVNHNSTLIESIVRKLQMIDLDGKETRCTHTLSHTPPHT
jgi:hypothetical protein